MSKAKLTDYRPQRKNSNKHTPRGLSALEQSIQQDGWIGAITVAADGETFDGSARIEVGAATGFEDAIVIESDGSRPIVHVRKDIPTADDPRARRLGHAANRVAQMNLDFDPAVILADIEAGVNLDALWRPDELEALVQAASIEAGAAGEPPETALDRAQALQKQYGVEVGQLWIIPSKDGKRVHRILCGDTRDEAQVARLMDGKKADLLHTDPPYGIGIVAPKGLATAGQVGGSKPFGSQVGATSGTSRKSSTGFDSAGLPKGVTSGIKTKPSAVEDRAGATLHGADVQRGPKSPNQIIQSNVYPVIQGDDEPFDPSRLLGFAPVVILWGANYYADKLPVSSCWLCWDKREGITRNSFADCELAWCSKSGPARIFHHLWNGLHKGSQHGERRTHPTEKPVALFGEIGKEYAAGGLWVDLYAGTGAQILAAERTGATCYACEIEPLYVATILDRCARMGLEPRLLT